MLVYSINSMVMGEGWGYVRKAMVLWMAERTGFMPFSENVLYMHHTVDSRYNKLLGRSEIILREKNYIRVAKTIIYKEILNFGTKKITLLYRNFVISVFFMYNESPLYMEISNPFF